MKKRIKILIFFSLLVLCLNACSKTGKDSTFSILFIDVGQGDSALVECDGHYMLIDGGDISAGDKVYNILQENDVRRLDILAISHLHQDHYGGLIKALTYATSIRKTISNSKQSSSQAFTKLENQLAINKTTINIPAVGDIFKLGSAKIEVVDVSSKEENDSLVLLITYGETKFLFTGDIGYTAQNRITQKYQTDSGDPYKINLLKMPHHGACENDDQKEHTLYRFLDRFMADYVIISVGKNNGPRHPSPRTLKLLNSPEYQPKVYQTNERGDIIVKSDGKNLSIETSK